MKLNEIQDYKNIGTIQLVLDDDGKKQYLYSHYFFNETYDEETIKGAKEMLDYEEQQARKVREAIYTLRAKGYKVFKEIA